MSTDQLVEDRNEIDSVIEVAKEAAAVHLLEKDRVYAVPDGRGGFTTVDTDTYRAKPRDYKDIHRELDDIDNFIEYLAAHDEGSTEIWAHLNPDRTQIKILAFLDAGTFESRQVTLRFDETRRWKEWQALNGQYVDQGRFAEFLEDHTEDLLDPDAATMLEVAQSLRASVKTDFQQSLRLDNGQTQLVYKEEIEGKAGRAGKLTIPNDIAIQVQPYTTSDPFKVEAKFRYRLNGGALSLGVKLMNADRVVEHVFNQLIEKLTASDVAPIFLGRP